MRLVQDRYKLTVINDQHGVTTGTDLIADVTAHAIRRVLTTQNISFSGVYHLVASGEARWHGHTSHVIEKAKVIYLTLDGKWLTLRPFLTAPFLRLQFG